MDTDQSGQPSLLYRGEISADVGTSTSPELYGGTVLECPGEINRDLEEFTTAKEIFTSIEISVVSPAMKLF